MEGGAGGRWSREVQTSNNHKKNEKIEEVFSKVSATSKSIYDRTLSTWQKETQVQRSIDLLYELQHFNVLVGGHCEMNACRLCMRKECDESIGRFRV